MMRDIPVFDETGARFTQWGAPWPEGQAGINANVQWIESLVFSAAPVTVSDVWDALWVCRKFWADGIIERIGPISVFDALLDLGLASSKREAREFLKNGSVRINGTKVVGVPALLAAGGHVIRRGKQHAGIVFVSRQETE